MLCKRLILIHGRSAKPRRAQKEAYVRQALLHGLARVSAEAARRVRDGEVEASLVYYGDVVNRIMCEARPALRATMELDADGTFYEKDGCDDGAMAALLARPTDGHTRAEYRRLVREHKDRRYLDDLARALSTLLPNSLSRRIILSQTPDLHRYITSHRTGSQIRQRLQGPMAVALAAGEDVAIVAHSMGSIASYDVLWKFSHMSEYETLHGKRVSLWLTLGSPLGDPAVRACLWDSNEGDDGRYPRNVDRWINVAAHDDFVAHDGSVADDFHGMKAHGCEITDLPRIYAFWVGEGGSNPHKFYGYLDHPVVAGEVARWVVG
ncbi:MAG TPA: hypothetical protein VNA89_04835 [Gemmatimonadaceae bacterium]|nr:hypothetical protein [Gemmatimonadaceae bacterium]